MDAKRHLKNRKQKLVHKVVVDKTNLDMCVFAQHTLKFIARNTNTEHNTDYIT